MALVRSWLGELSLEEFRACYFRKRPFALPNAAVASLSACTWESLDRLLAAQPDVLVVSKGKALDVLPPRSLRELSELFARGIGIVVRFPEQKCPALAALGREFARDIPGEQRILVFATPKGTHGFAWHYDAEEVFVVQTAGDKEYFFRANTVAPPPKKGFRADFSSYVHETTPLMSCRLLAGDFLYLPRGYWHVAHPHAHSLSISIGVFPDEPPRA